MHTTVIDDHRFHHNGDYSGDVRIIVPADKVDHIDWPTPADGTFQITIPFEVLAEFVGEAVRDARESRLEQLEWYEVLGLRGKE